ncbi:Folylpolyglutamate synthase-like protein, partial [Drosera capensis]
YYMYPPLDPKFLNGSQLGLSGEHQYINAGLVVALCTSWLRQTGHLEVLSPDTISLLPGQLIQGPSTAKVQGHTNSDPHGNLVFFLDGAHSPESKEICGRWFSHATKEDDYNTSYPSLNDSGGNPEMVHRNLCTYNRKVSTGEVGGGMREAVSSGWSAGQRRQAGKAASSLAGLDPARCAVATASGSFGGASGESDPGVRGIGFSNFGVDGVGFQAGFQAGFRQSTEITVVLQQFWSPLAHSWFMACSCTVRVNWSTTGGDDSSWLYWYTRSTFISFVVVVTMVVNAGEEGKQRPDANLCQDIDRKEHHPRGGDLGHNRECQGYKIQDKEGIPSD